MYCCFHCDFLTRFLSSIEKHCHENHVCDKYSYDVFENLKIEDFDKLVDYFFNKNLRNEENVPSGEEEYDLFEQYIYTQSYIQAENIFEKRGDHTEWHLYPEYEMQNDSDYSYIEEESEVETEEEIEEETEEESEYQHDADSFWKNSWY